MLADRSRKATDFSAPQLHTAKGGSTAKSQIAVTQRRHPSRDGHSKSLRAMQRARNNDPETFTTPRRGASATAEAYQAVCYFLATSKDTST